MLEREDEFEQRLVQWLEPDGATVDRVKKRSLSTRRSGRSARIVMLVSSLAALLALAAGAVWFRQPAVRHADEFTATFDGDVLLIRAAGGRTWIIGPNGPSNQAPGDWHVAFQGGR